MQNSQFGQCIRALREERGMTQEEFAELAGLHRTYISQLERGQKSPSLRTLWSLAEALKTRPSNIIKMIEMREESK